MYFFFFDNINIVSVLAIINIYRGHKKHCFFRDGISERYFREVFQNVKHEISQDVVSILYISSMVPFPFASL